MNIIYMNFHYLNKVLRICTFYNKFKEMNEFSLKCLLFCMCICNVTVKAWVGLCLMWCPFHFKSVFALLWTKLLEENRQNLHYIFRKWRKLHTWRKPHIPENGFLFVQGQDPSFAWRIKSVFAEFPGLVMRHEAMQNCFVIIVLF